MKYFIVLAICVAVALAIPMELVKYDSDNVGIDGYSYGSETSNGKFAEEEGQVKNIDPENEGQVRGQYYYTGPDGVVYTVTYK